MNLKEWETTTCSYYNFFIFSFFLFSLALFKVKEAIGASTNSHRQKKLTNGIKQ